MKTGHRALPTPVALAILFATAGLALPTPAEAYVGPGAGFAFVGSLMTLLLAFGAAFLMLLTWPLRMVIRMFRRRKVRSRARVDRLIVLGLDGLDPNLTEKWMAEGRLPNLKRLSEMGSFTRLRTTYPSISPVAWSSFMTGVDPARHAIFDFLDRDKKTYMPKLSSSEVGGPARTMKVGDWIIPLSKPSIRNMRKSKAFWTILGEHGIPCNILRVPLSFPPEKFAGALLSAMCVPDLRGTQGSFTYYTTDPEEAHDTGAAPEATGGERHLVTIEDGMIRATLPGPENTMREDGGVLELPFTVKPQVEKKQAILEIEGKKVVLKERTYSPWIRVTFKPGLGVKVHGIARFYVTKMDPHFCLYVTPINIDPGNPAVPISFPGYYSIYLSKMIGEFATLGLAEDTWALNERIIDEEAFLQQALDHHAEREEMFMNAVEKSREGVVACVFDGTDRLQHMFFRYLEEDHPANRGKDVERYRDVIRDMYVRCDELVGRLIDELGEEEQLIVLSDHGFQSFRRAVNLNTWLLDNGLLFLKDGEESGDWFKGIDWSRTKAYAFGLGGLYINQVGREEHGIVQPGDETAAVKKAIQDGLSGLRDEEAGDVAINEVFDNRDVHGSGPYRDDGPDLIIGYNRGYRASWEGAVGRVTDEVIADNTKSWSGDHCIDPRLVPGVLFSSRPIDGEDPGIVDMAPTILTQFGVDVPAHMTGRVLEVGEEAELDDDAEEAA